MLNKTKEYIEQMDSSMNDKALMLNYAKGNTIMDMGCASGSLLKMAHHKFPKANLIGMDKDLSVFNKGEHPVSGIYTPTGVYTIGAPVFSPQLIESDVLDLDKHVYAGEVDTFIFSSILHEVYSYNGFSRDAVESVLMQAIRLLPVGGRLIIRDGVKPHTNEKRYIKFVDFKDVLLAKQYAEDFKGYNVKIETVSKDTIALDEQDAMEFLYTYTWGGEHYKREVQEQYGLMSAYDWIIFVQDCFDKADYAGSVVTYNHYLQEGYNYHLSKRLTYLNTDWQVEKLPDSNGLFVFEKTK